MTKHTPGPWEITGPNIRESKSRGLLFVQEHPYADAEPDADEQAANRKLVAASPDLLRAAKAAAEYMQWHTEVCETPPTCPEFQAYQQLAAAIAKAEGKH